MWTMRLIHTNRVPDWLIRLFIRADLKLGAWRRRRKRIERLSTYKRALIRKLKRSPIAIHVEDANLQHYEVPSRFFEIVLGPRLKYSCCYWPAGVSALEAAEEAMLQLTCRRARLKNGMDVLDLGCGWGSLALWIAEHYPDSRVVAVSNSHSQREFIQAQSRARGLTNVEAITADVSDFEPGRCFDRVVSVEMFEHIKNYEQLMGRIASFLKPDGMLFVHIFSHQGVAFEFKAADEGNWMARTFFSGGTMPSDDLLLHFQRDLYLVDHWCMDGTHYERTLRAWLNRLDRHQTEVRQIMEDTYGNGQGLARLVDWRLFFITCEETWKLDRGREYLVSHYLFSRRPAKSA